MGYRGKLAEQERARQLRARAWTLQEIADELSVAKSSVSIWVRDVDFEPIPRKRTARSNNGPNALRRRKLTEIREMDARGRAWIGELSEREFLASGVALYAGEGAKTDGDVGFANTSPEMMRFFCTWLRHFFEIDESRLRCRLYLHAGLDLVAANRFWSEVTGVPVEQFRKPYRPEPDDGIRNSKHIHGCLTVTYSCSRTHRLIIGLVHGLLDLSALGPWLAERR
jgi:transcriptional regulator with XRE-family HTH domain